MVVPQYQACETPIGPGRPSRAKVRTDYRTGVRPGQSPRNRRPSRPRQKTDGLDAWEHCTALRKHHGAGVMYRLTLISSEKMPESDYRNTLKCIYNLAGALHKQREYDEVERLHFLNS
ncbi:hypothetical protein L873DRAFT_1162622 [Choiromyces venosus 120613-1]|uniref:Uncharacterized protein n=1 Tax=Choiromyces venosus 120613-1 TaxID=1336337 RepID=A0A3N4JTA3_9PEZI|nr:hypothetical protein L873DRAFT_1162622 [Choiromyces venosus 120613-1]